MSASAYRLGTDIGTPGGDMTAHVLMKVRHDGVLVTLYSFTHDAAEACDLCVAGRLLGATSVAGVVHGR